jgi:hypothetical protein
MRNAEVIMAGSCRCRDATGGRAGLLLGLAACLVAACAAPKVGEEGPSPQAEPLRVSAEAQPGACPAPGTQIVTSLGTTLRFISRDGLVCSLTTTASGAYQTFGLVTLVNSMNYEADKEAIATLWPLAVGKAVAFKAKKGSYEWIAAYTVTEKRDLTVAAGTFPVYVVRYEETQTSKKIAPSHDALYHSVWTYYISTDVGFFVKMDYQSLSGGPSAYYPHTPWEAVSITAPR